jgi:hypothetical protein
VSDYLDDYYARRAAYEDATVDEKIDALKERWAEEDRLAKEEDDRMFEAKAADVLVHLQRMRNARLMLEREPQAYYRHLGTYYTALDRIVDLLDDFRIDQREVPEFVMEQWDHERKQDLARRAA